MKLSNQTCVRINSKPLVRTFWQACFFHFFLISISVTVFLFSPYSTAAFCWEMDGQGSCDYEWNREVHHTYTETSPVNLRGAFETTSEPFRFRSYCLWGQCYPDWKLALEAFTYSGDSDINSDEINYRLKFASRGNSDGNWRVGERDAISGDYFDNNGFSPNTTLELQLSPASLKALGPGSHQFTFRIRGQAVGGWNLHQYLNFTFSFIVESETQVYVHAPNPISLGYFPSHSEREKRNFCVYASSDDKNGEAFSIQGTSGNGHNLFFMQHQVNTIAYQPGFAYGADASWGERTEFDGGKQGGPELIGSPDPDCGEGLNMTLFIELTEPFESLSQKPAGNYTDVLTITVSAN